MFSLPAASQADSNEPINCIAQATAVITYAHPSVRSGGANEGSAGSKSVNIDISRYSPKRMSPVVWNAAGNIQRRDNRENNR